MEKSTLFGTYWLELCGTPYVRNGRGKDGLDCVGLCLAVFEMHGFTVHDPVTMRGVPYKKDEDVTRELTKWGDQFQEVDASEPFRVLDVIVFLSPTHVGIMVTPNILLHISQGSGVRQVPLNAAKRHLLARFRLRPQ